MTSELLYGRNAVREALRARRRTLRRLVVSRSVQESGVIADIIRLAEQAGIAIERIERQVLDRQLRDANHQGVMLETGPYPYVELDECLSSAN
ncbi:MAG: 23S rRNA (guanosine(2251)-2'-O)-methyltransferase RlmB, partial [Chloroflexi bacterium]